jgi:hypothetical protein
MRIYNRDRRRLHPEQVHKEDAMRRAAVRRDPRKLDLMRAWSRRYAKTVNGIFLVYRDRARKYDLEFQLDRQFFSDHWQKPCFYCREQMPTVGFDRVDSALGYIRQNVVPSCGICNKMKLDQQQLDFIARCALIAKNHHHDKA